MVVVIALHLKLVLAEIVRKFLKACERRVLLAFGLERERGGDALQKFKVSCKNSVGNRLRAVG